MNNILFLKKDSKKGLSFLTGINREVIPGHVTKLANSINKMGCIRPLVVSKIKFLTGKEQLYIIDGQHLFNALIRNNMDIPYIEIEIKDKKELVETIALLNASSKSWGMVDYVNSWSCIHEDYRKLREYFNIYDFEIGTISSILSGNIPSAGGGMSRKIKNGSFKISNEKENLLIINNLTDILNIIPRMNRTDNRYLCMEYVSFLRRNENRYHHQAFLKNLKLKKEDFITVTQEPGKLTELFEKINK